MSQKPVHTRLPDTKRDKIEQYQEQMGYEHRSDAVEELIDIGLRESGNPILYRAKDQALEAAYYFCLVAIVTVVAGFTTSTLTPAHGMQVAFVLVCVAIAPPSVIELVRVATGRSEIGGRLRSKL